MVTGSPNRDTKQGFCLDKKMLTMTIIKDWYTNIFQLFDLTLYFYLWGHWNSKMTLAISICIKYVATLQKFNGFSWCCYLSFDSMWKVNFKNLVAKKAFNCSINVQCTSCIPAVNEWSSDVETRFWENVLLRKNTIRTVITAINGKKRSTNVTWQASSNLTKFVYTEK